MERDNLFHMDGVFGLNQMLVTHISVVLSSEGIQTKHYMQVTVDQIIDTLPMHGPKLTKADSVMMLYDQE